MTIAKFAIDDQEYVIDPPLRALVTFDVIDQFYVVSGDFDIYFVESTRDEAVTRLEEEVAFAWIDIAQEDDMDRLSERAQQVRMEMRERIARVAEG